MHQKVMLDRVEKLGKVHIHGYCIALLDIPAGLVDRIMGRPAGSKAKTRLRERRIEDRPQNLSNGLLDQAVQNTGDSKRAKTSRRFWNLHAADRRGLVGACHKRFEDLMPVATGGGRKLLDGQAIDSGCSAVCFNPLPGGNQIVSGEYFLQQAIIRVGLFLDVPQVHSSVSDST